MMKIEEAGRAATVSRALAFHAINTEREYQDNLARNTEKEQVPLEHLAIIRRICRDMEDSWYDNPGKADMSFMRKIAAVAVRAMEQHSAPARTFSEPSHFDMEVEL